jgi:glutamyl-tRNA reductase
MSILFRCYKKADAEIRGRFSLILLAKTRLLEQEERGDWKFNRNPTCNRTEIYGFVDILFN